MSSTLLERTRQLHESIERYELLIEGEMNTPPESSKDTILQNHRVNHYLESSINSSKELYKIYQDSDDSRKKELDYLSGKTSSIQSTHDKDTTQIFSSFYDKLREIKEYHRKYPDIKELRNNEALYFNPTISFLGNEQYGKYLDLNEIYENYINIPSSSKFDYITYLGKFSEFSYDDIVRMKYSSYREYLEKLYNYIISFLERTQPLFDLKNTISKYELEFNQKWDKGEFNPRVDNDQNNEESNNSLYCKACRKQFNSENVYNGHFTGKKHKLNQDKMINDSSYHSFLNLKSRKPITFLEFQIDKFANLLGDQIHSTKEMVLRKQSRNANEIEEDLMEDDHDEINIDDLDVNDEPQKLKIANYPVDWSGKPIPYWVYKLHELGVEYKCEICGNQSYWGRKAYEKHFQETRHANGMQAIGVPNTLHFHEITKIKDAWDLWEKIKKKNAQVSFKSDRDEEYEDENGDVMSKTAYELLVKQGIIKKRKHT